MENDKKIVYVKLDRIWPNPFQTRLSIDHEHIASIARDILKNGLLQNPVARPARKEGELAEQMGDSDVELAFGHNRHAAFYWLQEDHPEIGYIAKEHPEFDRMPIIIRDLTDEEMAITAWSENELHKQLNPVERAAAVKRFIDTFHWTHQQVAEKIQVDRSTVTNSLRLLKLPDDVLSPLADGALTQRQAIALLPFFDLMESEQDRLLMAPDFAEFLQMARQGQIDSDTIRAKITTAIEIIHPAPVEFEFPEEVASTGSATENQEMAWLQKDIDGNDVAPVVDPESDAEDEEPEKSGIPEGQPELPNDQVILSINNDEERSKILNWIDKKLNGMPAVLPGDTEASLSIRQESPSIPLQDPDESTQGLGGQKAAEPAKSLSWAESNYTITLGFMAEDGNEQGRSVVISVRRGEGIPKFLPTREKALNWALPWQIEQLINQLHPEDFGEDSAPLDKLGERAETLSI